MTNDYYINLADYYTNQLVSGTPDWIAEETSSKLNINFDDYFTTTLGATNYTIEKWLTWGGSNNLILYGTAEIGGNNKNYILRVPYENNTYNLTNASFYTTYEGGTSLPYFWDLIVDNDGSLYGIVSSSSPDSNGFALIMLGNPFITGGIKFRQSYIVPNTYSTHTNYNKLIKKENTGEYLIIFNDGGASTLILHLIINVGSSNTWIATTTNNFLIIYDYYLVWNENISLNLLIYDDTGEIGDYIARFKVYNYNGSSVTLTTSYSYSVGNRFKINTAKYINDHVIYYFVTYLDNYNGGTGNLYIILKKGDLNTNTTTTQFTDTYGYDTTTPYYFESLVASKQIIEIENGILFFKFLRTELPSPRNRDAYGFIILDHDNTTYQLNAYLKTSFDTTNNFNCILINFVFNNVEFLVPGNTFLSQGKIKYDPNGYNGTKYKDIDMFIPHRVELYNSSSKLLFNRDLYNLKVYGNVTEATVNVPNTMLNDDTIANSVLYGKTNYDLVDDNTSITKNIYENLMINFFNSIVVSDYTGRIYNNGGARVNDSISKTNDMSNASASKLKVFYSNNTTAVHLLPTPTITGSGNPMTIQYDTSIVVASLGSVLKYQILSNDEQTIYFEYDMSSVGAGIYQLTQECIVE